DGYNFSNARNMVDTNLVMRDEIIKEWKANGVNTKIQELLIAGVDDTKDNTKPEEGGNTGENGSTGETDNNGNKGDNNNPNNLPATGGQNPINLLIFALFISGVGYVMFRKKTEEKAS
ncbi:LPXTG cell wall anchor domain-containing protein, partial [Clostridium perfringens]